MKCCRPARHATASVRSHIADRRAAIRRISGSRTLTRRQCGNRRHREYLKPATAAAKAICVARYQQFGCAGMASKIKPVPLEKMAARYKGGELRQIVN